MAKLTMQVFMYAAAIEGWVEEEIGDAGNLTHEVEKRSGLDQFVKFAVSGRDLANARINRLAPHTSIDLVFRQRRIESGEIEPQPLGEALLEEVIYNGVPEGFA